MTPKTPEQHFARYRDAGDLTALAAVFDAVAGELLLVAGHLVRDGALAEDLVQTTFVEAMRSAARYDARRPLLPWLAQILTHHAKKVQRQQARAARAVPAAARGERDPVAHALDREAMAAIQSGLARLEPPYREVLTLRLVHELSPAAIAHAIGCPPETVRTRLKRGLEHLRRRLPAGLATSLALLLASGRGLAAVRADVLAHARDLATKATAGAGAAILGGLLMKQFLSWATILVLVVLLGWWGVAAATSATVMPEDPRGVASFAVADTNGAQRAGATIEREAIAASATTREQIVFTGRCVDFATRAPLAGVGAVVHRDVPKRDVCDNELAADPAAVRTVSGVDGVFRLACERVAGAEYDVRIGNREHVHRTRAFAPYERAAEVDVGDVLLKRGVQVTLTVVDRRGAPVAGVRVVAAEHQPAGRHDMLMVDTGFPWRSDAHGLIEPPYAMRPGHYDIMWYFGQIPAELGLAALEVPANRDQYHAVLVWPVDDARHAIHGAVVDIAGKPVADVELGAEGGGTRGNARTRADGTFRIPRIGPYDANAIGPVCFGLPDPLCGLEIVGEPVCSWGDRDVVVVVRPTATLVVRAVDATSGAVVRDVRVACAAHRDDGPPAVVWERPSPVEIRPDGSVARRVARCAHDVQVFPRDPSHAPSAKVVWDPRHGEELVVPVAGARSVGVRVVTADGEPVAGTELWTLQPIEAVAGDSAAAGWREVPMPGRPDPELDATRRWGRQGIDDAPLGAARTGADGRTQIRVPVDADVLVAAFGPGHVPKAVVGRATGDEIELRVERGTTLRIVLKPKHAVARLVASANQQRLRACGSRDVVFGGVELQIAPAAAGAADGDPRLAMETVRMPLSADGVCEHRGLPPGRYDVALSGNIESGELDGINVFRMFPTVTVHEGAPNEVELDVANLALERLQGQVLLNGRPWAYVGGCFWSMDWPAHRFLVPVLTDANGRFDVEAPAAGNGYQLGELHLSVGQTVMCAETVYARPGETTSAVMTAHAVTARARIVDATGAPAVGLTVVTDQEISANTTFSGVTDGDGWITITFAPPVPFHLIVRNPNGPTRAGRRTTSSGDAVLGPFQIPPTGDRAEFLGVLPEGWR
ncbi:MAG TPA: sigma-70 family RNA polymerase sigma factor [Planctomycetota bacterium]|nr:sigma-70 family RNA polymerase sigma factor [Planctomycetota bacterium]